MEIENGIKYVPLFRIEVTVLATSERCNNIYIGKVMRPKIIEIVKMLVKRGYLDFTDGL